ncbi:hypothetical protein F5Y08DRAFT_326799 [Xylaria arbuscula]|uniref:Uncharacterized protein n=1 Tax=Xylaria arbuscula TaxID=114810 RepID=A0A9W8NLG2_9PEZI|nr:hypothetical protein F5Y08DRAFT_326799 [Xylaria arbuscula]KAJ3578810.1 hypothetical protein NPX13_g1753 [Xylaria arbuscula]
MGAPLRRNGTQSDPWFRPELRKNAEGIGEAHDDEKKYLELTEKWAVDEKTLKNYPYLARVKRLSETGWIHLRLLTEFMSIGTVPQRWKLLDTTGALNSPEREGRQNERQRRIEKTNVTVLDYHTAGVKRENYKSAQALRDSLSGGTEDSDLKFKLYVVEDLSRDVIEILGQKFEIEPDFFRAHIVDFAWYNVRDRWRNPPMLDIVSRHQNWTQLRYVTARYFDINNESRQKNRQESFKSATKEVDGFNIMRRVDDDLSNTSYWDNQGAIVGLTRSRATFWLQPTHPQRKTPVGILLLDPTVTQGVPLWRGRRPLWPISSVYDPDQPGAQPPMQDNFFEDFIFWAQQKNLCPNPNANDAAHAVVPIQVLLHLICSEWITMSDYIKTRLNQLDWEIIKPQFFRLDKVGVANMLEKLHMWRRLVPLYREMVSETTRHVDQFSSRIETLVATLESTSTEESSQTTANSLTMTNSSTNPAHRSLISHYDPDFKRIKEQLEEYQNRIDQLTAVVTAVISIDNSQRSLQDNRNIGRLTWLATFFIPLSLIAGILSMQSNVSEISGYTFKVYFATSLPLSIVIAAFTITLSMSGSENKKKLKRFTRTLGKLQGHQKND